MSKKQHDKLLKDREARTEMNEKNRKKNRRRKKNKSADEGNQNNLSNDSFETRATILSDKHETSNNDIENGGIEIELDGEKNEDEPLSPMKGESEYLESDSPKRKPLFSRLRKGP